MFGVVFDPSVINSLLISCCVLSLQEGRTLRTTLVVLELTAALLPEEDWAIGTTVDHGTPEMLPKGWNTLNICWVHRASLGGPRGVKFDTIEGECAGPSVDRLGEIDENITKV